VSAIQAKKRGGKAGKVLRHENSPAEIASAALKSE